LFTPGEGHIDPYSLTQAIAIGARKWGAKILQVNIK
jgi:dimethylglycine dehydrogenase